MTHDPNDPPVAPAVVTAFVWFLFGLAIAGFFGALQADKLTRERNEARAGNCEQ